MRVLLTGWPSFLNGEATAGDVLSMDRVRRALVRSGVPCEVAWSQVFRPGSLGLDDADPKRYTHLVFICGPVHGNRCDGCTTASARAAGSQSASPVSTWCSPATPRRGRVGGTSPSRRALEQVPVVGVALAPGQLEYGERRGHDQVHQRITTWLLEQDCARVPVDTRLDPRQWRNPSMPSQLDSVLCRLDAVLTTRLHGLVLALRLGVPVLAVDPVDSGGKVGAQAAAWGWPALVTAGEVLKDVDCLRPWWNWCLSAEGRMLAAERATAAFDDGEQLVVDLLEILHVKIA